MNTSTIYAIEVITPTDAVLSLSAVVARVLQRRDDKVVGTIHRSFRNDPVAVPGRPVWWFCPVEPPTPVAESEVSEADIIRLAFDWLQRNGTCEPRRASGETDSGPAENQPSPGRGA